MWKYVVAGGGSGCASTCVLNSWPWTWTLPQALALALVPAPALTLTPCVTSVLALVEAATLRAGGCDPS